MCAYKRWVNQNNPEMFVKKGDNESDFLVFGYACKLFRDDQKAMELDQGRHLILWKGNENVKIDRYDARVHLSEMSQLEEGNQNHMLTIEEKYIEQQCDEERYRALTKNEEERELYREEELKRRKQSVRTGNTYSQVAYQYIDSEDANRWSASKQESVGEKSEPFVPSRFLDIPPNMMLPKSIKDNLVIEKTATLITKYGPQMEVLLKMRLDSSHGMDFLKTGSPLNPYYSYILSLMKSGRYRVASEVQSQATTNQEYDHNLNLRMTTVPATSVDSAPNIPSIPYKPSSDCSYNQLVSKILHIKQNWKSAEDTIKSEIMDSSSIEEVGLYTSGEAVPSSLTYTEVMHDSNFPAGKSNSSPRRLGHSLLRASVENGPSHIEKMCDIPPPEIREVISRLIAFSHSTQLHPSDMARNLWHMNKTYLDFVDPSHKYHDYYVQQLQKTFKEHTIQTPLEESQSVVTSKGHLLINKPTVTVCSEDRNGGYPVDQSSAFIAPLNGSMATFSQRDSKHLTESQGCSSWVDLEPSVSMMALSSKTPLLKARHLQLSDADTTSIFVTRDSLNEDEED